MTPSDLVDALDRHGQWLLNQNGGSPADLALQNLYGYDLTGVKLNRAKLTGVDFGQAILTRADLSGSDLFGASFVDAKLQDASLKGANLRGAQLKGCDLTGANLAGADLRDGGLLRACRRDGLTLANPEQRVLEAELADLSGADLSGRIWRIHPSFRPICRTPSCAAPI